MTKKKILTILFMLHCTAQLVCAQIPLASSREDFKEVLRRLRAEYNSLEKVHIMMSIQVFENAASTKPYFNEVADIKRDKSNYLHKYAGHEMLMNDKYMLMVDHSSKEIFCNTRNIQAAHGAFKTGFQWDIDSLMQFYGEPVYIGRQGHNDHYKISQKVGQVEIIDLFIDSSNSSLSRIDYMYRDKQYVKIEFKVFNRQPDFDALLFSERNYFVRQKNKMTASEKFHGFTVRNVNETNNGL